jgi:ABC-type antimicrobial peptide transport system permease subunit
MAAFIRSSEGSAVLRQQLIKIINESGIADLDQAIVNKALSAITDGFAEYAVAHGMDLSDQTRYSEYYQEYLQSDEGKKIVNEQSEMISKEITDKIKITPKQAQGVAEALLDAYSKYATENNLPDPKALEGSLKEYMGTDRAKKLITSVITSSVNVDEITNAVMKNVNNMTSKFAGQLAKGIEKAIGMVVERLASNMTKALQDTFSDFGSALSIDQDAFAKAFQFNMGEDEMKSFMSELMGGSVASAEGNLAAFGYCDREDLQSITIYPKDFESKDQITTIIKDYNKMVEDRGEEDKSIVYTDIVGALMKSVTKIINTISYVLIAFVAISLVVSSIMIGVITYISVLERRKEIGILRAMGASKRNVADVFNAETMITGFLAGLFGVIISLILLIPINSLIHKLAESSDVSAIMPWQAAIILVVLSIILTLIGGLIPSKTASRQDPVTALRTE